MEPLLNNIIRAFGWSIFHSLWQGAIIYGFLFSAILFIPRITAQTKHNLAFGSICITFLSFCITFCTIFEVPNVSAAHIALATDSVLFSDYLPSLSERISNQAEQFFPTLLALYGIGLGMQFVILLNGYGKLNKLKKSAKTAVPDAWMQIFDQTRERLNIRKKVTFYLSDKVNVPLVLGFLKPIVLFPAALANNLDLNQVEAILIHELSHIRRNDYLLNMVKTVVETILFFNPFVWLIGRFIQIEREHACDDLVVAFTGTPVTYAHALLKLELLQDKNSPALALAATGKPQYLYQRIKRITNMKANYMNVRQQILLITLTFSTIISLAWINPEQSKAAIKELATKVAYKMDVFLPEITIQGISAVPVKTKNSLPTDTIKKKPKLKIIIENGDGIQTTYNSVDDLPDSLKKQVYSKGIYLDGKRLSALTIEGKGDTTRISGLNFRKDMSVFKDGIKIKDLKHLNIRDSVLIANIPSLTGSLFKELNSPEAKEKVRGMALEMSGVAERMTKEFNTPEAKEKWEKLQLELRKNSDEFIKKFNTPEQRARLMKLVQDAQRNTAYVVQGYPSKLALRLDTSKHKLTKIQVEDNLKLLSSPEYQELRKKFDREVEELKKKKGIDNNK